MSIAEGGGVGEILVGIVSDMALRPFKRSIGQSISHLLSPPRGELVQFNPVKRKAQQRLKL